MLDKTHLNLLALYTPSATAQKILRDRIPKTRYLTTQDTLGYLAQNQWLDPTIWWELWKTLDYNGPSVSGYWVEYMLRSAPTLRKAKQILKRNDEIVLAYIELGSRGRIKPIPEEIRRELQNSERFTKGVYAAAFINSGELEDELLLPYWDRALTGYQEALTAQEDYTLHGEDYADHMEYTVLYLATLYKSVTDAQLLEIVRAESIGFWEVASKVVDLRPSVIPLMLADANAKEFYYALATSRHTTAAQAWYILDAAMAGFPHYSSERTIGALTKNLALPPALRLKAHNFLADPQTLVGIGYAEFAQGAMEALAKDVANNTPPPKAPWEDLQGAELAALVVQLGAGVLNYPTLANLEGFAPWNASIKNQDFSEDFILQTLSPSLDRAGPTAWLLFIEMLDGWAASIEDLIEVVEHTAVK